MVNNNNNDFNEMDLRKAFSKGWNWGVLITSIFWLAIIGACVLMAIYG